MLFIISNTSSESVQRKKHLQSRERTENGDSVTIIANDEKQQVIVGNIRSIIFL